MSKTNRIFLISIIIAVLSTLAIIIIPNRIDNYVGALNPEAGDVYEWKFQVPDTAARITAWGFFVLHFATVGYFMTKLKKNYQSKGEISKYNVYLLLVNFGFIILHYIHTIIWYDALAQDTPVWSSQGSVIIMLILVLIIENRRRGLFFGKKMPFPKESTRFVMKYHGIYISLATIFTFWFHPMENELAHLFGFFYMYLLFIQLSLAKTKLHHNYIWTIILEVTVLVHGTIVAISTDNAPYAMFLFGFATVFFVTQIYGLKLKKSIIMITQILYLVLIVLEYSGVFSGNSWANINEVFRIPVIDYLLVFVFVYVIYIPYYFKKKRKKKVS